MQNNNNNNNYRKPYYNNNPPPRNNNNNNRKMIVYRMTVRYNPLEIMLEFKDYPDMTLKSKDAEKWIEEMKRDLPAVDWNVLL